MISCFLGVMYRGIVVYGIVPKSLLALAYRPNGWLH